MTDLTYADVRQILLVIYHGEKGAGRLLIKNPHIQQLEKLLGENHSDTPIPKPHFDTLLAFITSTLPQMNLRRKSGKVFQSLERKFKQSNQFEGQPERGTAIDETHRELIREYNEKATEANQIAARFIFMKKKHPAPMKKALHQLDAAHSKPKHSTLKQNLLSTFSAAFNLDTTASQLLSLLTNKEYPILDTAAPIHHSAEAITACIETMAHLIRLYTEFSKIVHEVANPKLTMLVDHTKHPLFHQLNQGLSPIVTLMKSNLIDEAEKEILITQLAMALNFTTNRLNVDLSGEIDGVSLPPLEHALRLNNLAVLKMLIAAGDNVNRSIGGVTPLHRAAESAQLVAMRLLINAGAKVDGVDSQGRTPLHLTTDPEAIKILLEHDADPKKTDHHHNTVLHHLCNPPYPFQTDVNYEKRLRSMALLIRPENVNARNNHGETPLHCACLRNPYITLNCTYQRIALLLHAGANPNLRTRANVYGYESALPNMTPLLILLHKKPLDGPDERIHPDFFKIVQLLIEKGANPHCSDDSGTLLQKAAQWAGNAEMMTYLLKQGCSPNNITNASLTPLHTVIKLFCVKRFHFNPNAFKADFNTVGKPYLNLLFEFGANPFLISKKFYLTNAIKYAEGIPNLDDEFHPFFDAHIEAYLLKMELVRVLVLSEPWNTLSLHVCEAILNAALPKGFHKNTLQMIDDGRTIRSTSTLGLFSQAPKKLTCSTDDEVQREKRNSLTLSFSSSECE